jgi:uncharacterized protein (TIGR00730 family)
MRGTRPAFAEAAQQLGESLARNGLGLVYGGGSIGLMGVLADAALAAGGRVVGVIPDSLALKEIAHSGLTELHLVTGMHERKALMAHRSAAFLAMPGGLGTLEEFFEVFTWAVLGLHSKPIGLLNVDHYFDPLLSLLNHAVAEGFVKPEYLEMVIVSDDPESMPVRLLEHKPPESLGPRWIDSSQT